MGIADIAFILVAAFVLICAFVVVFHNKIIYSAFALLFCFLGIAGIYIFLNAEFLAGTQLIVYVGGISVLILFGILLTKNIYDVSSKEASTQRVFGGLISVAFLGGLIYLINNVDWKVGTPKPVENSTVEIGKLFMSDFLVPFEIAGVLLLVALIGAVVIGRDTDKDLEV